MAVQSSNDRASRTSTMRHLQLPPHACPSSRWQQNEANRDTILLRNGVSSCTDQWRRACETKVVDAVCRGVAARAQPPERVAAAEAPLLRGGRPRPRAGDARRRDVGRRAAQRRRIGRLQPPFCRPRYPAHPAGARVRGAGGLLCPASAKVVFRWAPCRGSHFSSSALQGASIVSFGHHTAMQRKPSCSTSRAGHITCSIYDMARSSSCSCCATCAVLCARLAVAASAECGHGLSAMSLSGYEAAQALESGAAAVLASGTSLSCVTVSVKVSDQRPTLSCVQALAGAAQVQALKQQRMRMAADASASDAPADDGDNVLIHWVRSASDMRLKVCGQMLPIASSICHPAQCSSMWRKRCMFLETRDILQRMPGLLHKFKSAPVEVISALRPPILIVAPSQCCTESTVLNPSWR